MDQEVVMKLERSYQQSREIEEKLGIVEQQVNELQMFETNLKELESIPNKEMLASLGKGVFVKADMKEKKLYVDVGSGVLIKKTPAEALVVVKDQMEKLGEMQAQLQGQYEVLSGELQALMRKAEESQNAA
jgi:prefoldin alpha subunit